MATLVHYFPFKNGAFTDVAGNITLSKQGTQDIVHAVINGVDMLHFQGDDVRLNLLGGDTIEGDWSVAFRLRLANNQTDDFPYPLSLPGVQLWLEKYESGGSKKIWLAINHYGGDANTSNTAGSTDLEMTLPSGVDYDKFDMSIVITVSTASGLEVYINTQAGAQTNTDSVPWLNLAQGTTHNNAWPPWPAFIGAGRNSWEGGPVYIGDFAIFQGVLTEEERADIWADGESSPLTVCVTDPEAYPLLCPPEEPPFVDWVADVDLTAAQEYWALEIDDTVLDAIRIPISSWQGTLQLERASYAQAVIPSALPWVDAVKARSAGDLIIYRGVRHPDGTTQEAEMARAPIQQVQLDQGPINATMTVSGYRTRPAPQQILVRPLQNVRSQSSGAGGTRFRSDIDWFLRPGHQATARGTSIRADYINYYVTGGQAYMDVGQRRAAANPGIAVGQSIASGPALVPSVGVSVSLTDGQSAAAGRVLVPDTGA